MRLAARALLRLTVTGMDVSGAGAGVLHGRCVIVANHASWLDAPVLLAWLPPDVTFVAGEVFRRQRVAGYLMRRIGVEFVERSDPGQGVSDTGRLVEVAAGSSIVIFPEGGLSREPGLRPFHMGAFVVAVESGLPVFPLAITGTRSMLHPGHKMVRRGHVGLVVGRRLEPPGPGWPGAVELRRLSREAVLDGCGERDLSSTAPTPGPAARGWPSGRVVHRHHRRGAPARPSADPGRRGAERVTFGSTQRPPGTGQ